MDGDAASGAATASEHGAAVFPQTMAYTLEMLEEARRRRCSVLAMKWIDDHGKSKRGGD